MFGEETPFSRFGVLLPILMVLLVPVLGLLYVGKHYSWFWLFKGAGIATIVIIILASALIVVSGIYGAVERAKYKKLEAGINAGAHRRPPF